MTFTRLTILIALLLSSLTAASPAQAAKFELLQLDELDLHLQCRDDCANGKPAKLQSCLNVCPQAPAGSDKDLSGGAPTWRDSQLAWLEYWDNGTGTRMCTVSGAVVPLASCAFATCASKRGAAACTDVDGDGLPTYVESILGTEDLNATTRQAQCTSGQSCAGGFQERCVTPNDSNGGSWCIPRTACPNGSCAGRADYCPNNVCTAFHLAEVASDEDQLIARVYYDYSPSPATVLDLRIDYDPNQLTLTDSRPMPAVSARGKDLMVKSHDADTLRVIIMGAGNTSPIPVGAVAELVFRRVGTRDTNATVQFASDPVFRQNALAPSQAGFTAALGSTSLWGPIQKVNAPVGRRLSVYLSFDNPNELLPIWKTTDTNRPQTGPELCALDPTCGSNRLVQNRYAALQRGRLSVTRTIDGPSGSGVYLDGYANHLELPVVVNDPGAPNNITYDGQDYTVSFWMYNDDDAGRANQSNLRILFSRNTQGENTGYGLAAKPVSATTFDLVYFDGDLSVTVPKTVSAGLTSRKWTHVAMTYTGASQQVAFFVDGVQRCVSGGIAVACGGSVRTPLTFTTPNVQYPGLSGRVLSMHEEGDLAIGKKSTDQIYLSSSINNQYGIEQMDTTGLDRTTVLRALDSSARDVDYSPLVDKIVYSSNATGSYEIWIANADGSDRQRITSHFGDTGRGIFARRPKWSFDAKGIVFESNVARPDLGDNASGSYNLYFIEYDPTSNPPRLFIGGTADGPTELDYDALVASQSTQTYRLTPPDTGNYSNARWLRPGTPGADRGELVANFTDVRGRGGVIKTLIVRNTLRETQSSGMGDLHAASTSYEEELLAAHWQGGQTPTKKYFFRRKSTALVPHNQFTVSAPRAVGANRFDVDIIHAPSGYAANCWDLNFDGNRTLPAEDLDGNLTVNEADCYPAEIGNLLIKFPAGVTPLLTGSASDANVTAFKGTTVAASKILKATYINNLVDGEAVRVGMSDPTSSVPIAAGVVATLRFTGALPGSGSITAIKRSGTASYHVQTDAGMPVTFEVHQADLTDITDADFSPAGDRLVLAGIQKSRPVLVTTQNLTSTSGMSKISSAPVRLSGLQWVQVQRFYPAAWVGAFRDGQTRLYRAGFRGALDELKWFNYVRPSDSFDTEAALGRARLVRDYRDGVVAQASTPCTTSVQCPSYQQCVAGQCTVVKCPNGTCAEGQCALLPVPSGNDGSVDIQKVCYSECSQAGADAECFSQECYNGPCRFCTAERACVECKAKQPHELDDGVTLYYADGCPDRNSFACESGSCVSDCYSFAEGQSQYLCNPGTEYCREGRCVAFDWAWTDLSPFTFASAGEARYDQVGSPTQGRIQTQAIPQLYPIQIVAYGSEDYFHAPTILVQGKVTGSFSTYGTGWFDIGKINVYHKTQSEALSKPYTLLTPEPVTELRMQLVEPGWPNPTVSATGTMTRNRHFCGDAALLGVSPATNPELNAPIPAGPNPSNDDACFVRPSGSMAQRGYRVGFLESAKRLDCAADFPQSKTCGAVETVAANPRLRFLQGGQPAVIIHELKLNDAVVSLQTAITKNTTCSYEGQADITDGTVTRRMWFGDPSKERSGQRTAYYPTQGAAALADFTTVSNKLYGLLNCNFADPSQEGSAGTPGATKVAELVISLASVASYPTSSTSVPLETPNACLWEVGKNSVPCFEWLSGPSIDSFSQPPEVFRTIEIDTIRASGFQ